MKTVPDILEEAADLIETVGWTQGRHLERDQDLNVIGYCAIGAIAQAVGLRCAATSVDEMVSRAQASARAEVHLNKWMEKKPGGRRGVVLWNDLPGRTAAEVIDALKQCAKDFRNKAVPDG